MAGISLCINSFALPATRKSPEYCSISASDLVWIARVAERPIVNTKTEIIRLNTKTKNTENWRKYPRIQVGVFFNSRLFFIVVVVASPEKSAAGSLDCNPLMK